jgi:hypothetical protein
MSESSPDLPNMSPESQRPCAFSQLERHLCSQGLLLQTELSEVDVPQAKHSGAHKPRATVGRTSLSTDMLTYSEEAS